MVRIRRILDFFEMAEMVLKIFFVMMDSIALIVLIAPKGNVWTEYVVLLAAIALSFIWAVKPALKRRSEQS